MRYLVSGVEMSELDRQTIQDLGVPGRVLLEVAGRHVAEVAARAFGPPPKQVAVVCGGGNNGGDGFVAARSLRARGYQVTVYLFADRQNMRGDAEAALRTLERSQDAEVIPVTNAIAIMQFAQGLRSCQGLVDALLGTGLHDAVRGVHADAISLINEWRGGPVVSVDLPSGVNADTGAVMGPAIQAHHTVTFAFPKRGHYLYPGAEHRGELTVADIGIPERFARDLGVRGALLLPEDGPQLVRARGGDSHKGNFGHAVVLAGSPTSGGAAILALRAALRSGVGLLTWSSDSETLASAPPRPPEAMVRVRHNASPVDWAQRATEQATALIVGPGLGTLPSAAEFFAALLRHTQQPMCLDADALNLIAANPALWGLMRHDAVLTPHPKEMARLCGLSVEEVQRDRIACAAQLAMARRCTVVLKGAGTVVADAAGSVAVVAAGNAGMATGGTGDVLAGIIGGLLAQRMEPVAAAQAGVLLHGAAGDAAAVRHGQAGLSAGDVVECMSEVWSQWQR